eukprot:299230_1
MSSSGKKKKKTFQLKEESKLDVNTITKIAKERKKYGLIISNSADVPLWMSDDELPNINNNIIVKRPKPPVFAESPLKGTFTDGYAMYSTFMDVENVDIKFGINMNGSEILNFIAKMFKQTENGVLDFFIYYSGIGKSFNGDWLGYNEDEDQMNIIPLTAIVKKWKQRPNKNKNQYLLIVSDTNYSGIWVSKAKDLKLLQKHNILVQSSVGRDESSLEMTIGEIKPPCWISQIICGKFTHNWIEIAQSKFYNKKDAIINMKGSFVILDKKIIWDKNEEYFAETDNPMSNIYGTNDEKTIVIIPAFGYDIDQIFNGGNIEQELQNVLAEIKQDDQQEEKKEKNVQYATLKGGNKGNTLTTKRRTSHLPQPSVRRLNLLQGVVGGMKLKRHKKMKSRHVSTYSRGFIFTKVLKDIRHLVMGSDEDDQNNDDNDDWIND